MAIQDPRTKVWNMGFATTGQMVVRSILNISVISACIKYLFWG